MVGLCELSERRLKIRTHGIVRGAVPKQNKREQWYLPNVWAGPCSVQESGLIIRMWTDWGAFVRPRTLRPGQLPWGDEPLVFDHSCLGSASCRIHGDDIESAALITASVA